MSTPNGRFTRQRCGWHFKAASDRTLSLKCRIQKKALRNCKKTYLRVNGRKYCGKVSKIEIPEITSLSLTFTSKLNGKAGFACKITPVLICPEPWKHFGGFCYVLSSDTTWGKKNWTASSDTCKSVGGNLTSIHSLDENAFHQSLHEDMYPWIGLTNSTNTLSWTDGTPVDYVGTWFDDDTDGSKDCGYFATINGTWLTDDRCNGRGEFICKKKSDLF